MCLLSAFYVPSRPYYVPPARSNLQAWSGELRPGVGHAGGHPVPGHHGVIAHHQVGAQKNHSKITRESRWCLLVPGVGVLLYAQVVWVPTLPPAQGIVLILVF